MTDAARVQVIVLNGIGSVGKTSTARALQEIARKPLLHVAMDAFLEMLPPAMIGHPDGLVMQPGCVDGRPSVEIRSGPVLARAMDGMRHAIAAMAACGNHLVVDEVLTQPGGDRPYRALLSGHDLRFVGLFAPLDVLEAREARRGDRMPGLARWQFGRVHAGIAYDLEIDTTGTTPEHNARLIQQAFGI